MSWIHLIDLCRAVNHVVNTPSLRGPVNFVGPAPVTNYEFTKTLGSVLRRPTLFWVPEFILRGADVALGGLFAETALSSQRVLPKRLTESGFKFEFNDCRSALEECFK
jgi:NAD dependent epimerase/dehydratase family enzyme